MEATVRFAVGETLSPHRCMLKQGDFMDSQGWSHLLSFYAYATRQPGTSCYAVGEAFDPHRMMIVQQDVEIESGWNHVLFFFAYEIPQCGTVVFDVEEVSAPHRVILCQRKSRDGETDSGPARRLSFYAYPFAPSARESVAIVIPDVLQPLFGGHCLTFSDASPKPGRGMKFDEGGLLEPSRQDAFHLVKSALLDMMLSPLLEALSATSPHDKCDYYVTGTQAINYFLKQRGCRAIPTDDIDAKFRPSLDLGATLQKLTVLWLDIAKRALQAGATALLEIGLVCECVEVLPPVVCNWAGLRVALRDVHCDGGPFHWDLAQVGDFDFDHWDVGQHTVAAPSATGACVRYLSEAAAVGDLAVVWPRTASSKTRRRLLKADYWRWATGNATLPDCVGTKPPPTA